MSQPSHTELFAIVPKAAELFAYPHPSVSTHVS